MNDPNPLCDICDYPVMLGAPLSLCKRHIVEAHEFAVTCLEISQAPGETARYPTATCPMCALRGLIRDLSTARVHCERRFGGCGYVLPPAEVERIDREEAEAAHRHYSSIATEREAPAPRSTVDAKVYYIAVGDRVKIGASINPASRALALSLRPENVAATEQGGFPKERERHEQFAHLRISGEWFRAEPDLMAHIASLQQ